MNIESDEVLSNNPFLEFCRVYDADDSKNAMLNACEALIHKSKVKEFPVSFNELLKTCDARLVEKDIPTLGRLEIEDNCYAIYVSENGPEVRKRFTIAHEIGHILMIEALSDRPDLIRKLRSPSKWFIVEKLCDTAASEILMPTQHFIHMIKDTGLTSEGIDRICKYFNVSRESFFKKFKHTFNPSAVILCKSQSTGMNKILPEVFKIYSGIQHLPIKEGKLENNNINLNLIAAAVKNGHAWSNSLVYKIREKPTRILRLAMVTSNSVHYQRIKSKTLNDVDYLEKDYRKYDVMLFYLPLEGMSNAIDLLHAVKL